MTRKMSSQDRRFLIIAVMAGIVVAGILLYFTLKGAYR
jgi:hypothetical protein